jgi:hypothetical protein
VTRAKAGRGRRGPELWRPTRAARRWRGVAVAPGRRRTYEPLPCFGFDVDVSMVAIDALAEVGRSVRAARRCRDARNRSMAGP